MPAITTGAARPRPTGKPAAPVGGGLTGGQKAALMLGAVLVGPAVMKKFYEEPEKVDLSAFNMVTSYDTPAIERLDSTLRIEFCSS